jgi:ethanolamine ammonia-lyase large subunit
MNFSTTIRSHVYKFNDLKTLLAKATPLRTGDVLAGLSAASYEERVAAQIVLADVPLKTFLNEVVIPYETDEITRLIIDSHDEQAFEPVSHFTIGELRDWLLSDEVDNVVLQRISAGLIPEMGAAVSKIMSNQRGSYQIP